MKTKVRNFFVITLCFMIFSVGLVYAHVGDIFLNGYVNDNQELLKLYVDSSALSNGYTMAIYRRVLEWNDISTGVEVSVIEYHTGMSDAGFFYIRGANISRADGTKPLGETISYAYNSQGVFTICSPDAEWKEIVIKINTDTTVFDNCTDSAQMRGKIVIHEVGHALKLAHPEQGNNIIGHIIPGGYAFAVMNQGDIVNQEVASEIVDHDRENLIYKWGE